MLYLKKLQVNPRILLDKAYKINNHIDTSMILPQ